MQKAKQAVSDFVSRDGHHKTTVTEDVSKPVTDEHVHQHQHENVTTAVDKEVHQDHHMTTVQPIAHKETLPEQHHHNVMPVQEKTIHHGNEQDTRAKIQQEAAQFKDTSVKHDTTHSSSVAPTVAGERVHHHVHEHVQPVIQKEVHAPHVVHTTVPVHEVHHAAAQHHGTKVLPTKTLDEFTSGGGVLKPRETHRVGEYDGCPESAIGSDVHKHTQGAHMGHKSGATNAGPHDSNVANKMDPRVDSDMDHRARGTTSTSTTEHRLGDKMMRGSNDTGGYALAGNREGDFSKHDTTSTTPRGSQGVQTAHVGTGTSGNTLHSHSGTAETGKPSLLDKLNPLK